MPSSKEQKFHTPSGGVDRSDQSFLLDPGSFQVLLNMRPDSGPLVQTPGIYPWSALTTLGGVTPTQVRALKQVLDLSANARLFILDQATARYTDTVGTTHVQIPFVLATAVPNRIDVTGQCLLYGISTAVNFTSNNDQYDIQITGTSTFQYRLNGGAWTSGLTVGPAVALGVTGLYASFLTTTGYTTSDTWSWKRTTTPYQGLYPSYKVQLAQYRRDTYVAGYDRHVLRLRDGTLTNVGYKRIYGKYCTVFYNHLVVAQFAEGVYDVTTGVKDSFDQTVTPWKLSWSDLNNPDNFFGTSINEADTYDVTAESLSDSAALGITGMEQLNNQNFIYLSDEIYSMTYVGLPNVMQVESMNFKIGSTFQGGVCATPKGHFFIGRDDIYMFNGVQVKSIGQSVNAIFFQDVAPEGDTKRQQLFSYYDRDRNEVIWHYWHPAGGSNYQARQLVYQIYSGKFFFRNVPSAQSSSHEIRAIERVYGQWLQLAYGGTAAVLRDASQALEDFQFLNVIGGSGLLTRFASSSVYNAANTGTQVKDAVSSAGVQSYTQPLIMSQDLIYDDIRYVKEIDSLVIDAQYISGSGVQVQVSARNLAATETISFTTLIDVWVNTLPELVLSLPRISGRIFRFMFTFTGIQPIGSCFRGWGEAVYGRQKDVQE